jgi:hypothetical protein
MLLPINKSDSTYRSNLKTLYNNLYKWVTDNNGKVSKLAMKFITDSNRFMVATEDIKKDETFLEFPKNIVLNPEQKEIKEISTELKKAKLTDYTFPYVVWIMRNRKDKNNKSFFKLFIKLLPGDCDEYPYFYKKDDRRLLLSSPAQKIKMKKIQKEMKNNYTMLEKKGFTKGFSLKEFVEAYLLFQSRDFRIGEKTDDIIMVPFADLFNTERKQNAVWDFDRTKEHFLIYASRDIKKGEEITLDYGDYSNSYFLHSYGFNMNSHTNKLPTIEIKNKSKSIELDGFTTLSKALHTVRSTNTKTVVSADDEIKALDLFSAIISKKSRKYRVPLKNVEKKLKNKKIRFNTGNILRVLAEERQVVIFFNE